MYRILLNGNIDFTANIKCDAFEVVCLDRVAYCYYPNELPQSAHRFSVNEDNIVTIFHTETKDNKTSEYIAYQGSKKELVSLVFNGFDPEKILINNFTDKLAIIDYANSIMSDPVFSGLYKVLEEKRKDAQMNLEEKLIFLKYWLKFKESKAYRIIKLLFWLVIGVGLTYMIATFSLYLASFFHTKVKTIKVRIDDKTILDVNYKYEIEKNIDENLEEITARFYCDIIDNDYGEIGWSTFKRKFKEIVFDLIIPQNDELKNVKHVDIASVTLQSEHQRKKDIRVIKNEPVKDIAILQKNTLYDGNKKKHEQEPRPFRSATTLQGSDNQRQCVMNKIEGNIMKISTQYDGYADSMHGINIGNNIVITMYHLVCDKTENQLNENPNYFSITGHYLFNDEKTYQLRPIIADKARDLLVLKIVDKVHQPRPNIVKYFKSEKTFISPLIEFINYKEMNNRVVATQSIGTTQIVNLAFDVINLKKGVATFMSSMLKTHGIVSAPGSCGLPLYNKLSSDNTPILGLHYGSCSGYIQAVQITKEYLETQILPQLSDVQSEHIPDAECVMEEEDTFYDCTLIEYEGPDQQTERVMIDKLSFDTIMTSTSNPKFRFNCLDEGEHTTWFGYTPKGARSHRLTPKYQRTPFSEDIEQFFPCEEDNAITDNRYVIDPSDLPCDNMGNPSIMMGQQNKLNDPIDAQGEKFADYYMQQAKELLTQHYCEIYGKYKHRLLTDLEVINGLQINPREPFFGNLEPVAMDGACGADISAKFNVTQKKDMFTRLQQKSPTGRDLHWWNDSPAARYCVAQSLVQQQQWIQGRRCESLVQSNLKCELRLKEKVRKGKTRVFESFTTCTTNNTRKYLGTICAAIKMERQNGFSQIGIDTIDFQQLYKRFKLVGDYGEHGDFSAWDKHLIGKFMEMAADIWTDVFFASRQFNQENIEEFIKEREDYRNVVKQIIISSYKGIIIADGHIFTKDRGNCSGSQITTPINGEVNTLMRVALILYLISKHNVLIRSGNIKTVRAYYADLYKDYPELLDLVETSRNIHLEINVSSMKDLLKMTDFANYGDDVCSAIKADYLWLLNFVQYQNQYKYLFGITYDSPHKDGSVTPFVKLTELNFISRTFHLDDDMNIITPQLKLSSITRLLHWCTKNSFEQITTNLAEIFDELIMYDINTWNKYSRAVTTVINPYLRENYGNIFTIPNYRLKRVFFQEQVRYRNDSSSIDNQMLTGSNKLTEEEIIKIFSNTILEGVSTQSTLSPSKMTTNPMIEYHSTQKDVANDFNKVMEYMPSKFQYRISGAPAMLISKHGKVVWSISCTGPINGDLFEIEQEMKRVLSKRETHLKYVDVTVCLCMAPGPSHRIQFKMTFCNGRNFTEVDNYRVSFSNFKLESSSAAAVDPIPQMMEGAPVPIQDSGIPTALHQLGYSQKSTAQLAYEFAPLANYQIPVGSTYGKVIFNLTRNDLINQFMTAAKTGDTEFAGSFTVKVVNQVNPGLTGTLIVGMTKTKLEQPTETDMLTKTIYHLDGNTAQSIELTIHPFAGENLPTRFQWPPVAAEDKFFPSLVMMVKTDFVSTFDNKSLYSQVQLYTKFSSDVVTFFNGFPEKSLFDSKNITDSVGTTFDASEIFGKNARFFTDGSQFIETKFNFVPQNLKINFNSTVNFDKIEKTRSGVYVIPFPAKPYGEAVVSGVTHDFETKCTSQLKIKAEVNSNKEISVTTTLETPKEIDSYIKLRNATQLPTYMDFVINGDNLVWRVNSRKSEFTKKITLDANTGVAETPLVHSVHAYGNNPDINNPIAQRINETDIAAKISSDGLLSAFQIPLTYDTPINTLNFNAAVSGTTIKVINDPQHAITVNVTAQFVKTLEVDFDPAKIYKVGTCKATKYLPLPSGASALQVMDLPYLVPTPTEGAMTGGNPTLFTTQFIFKQLSLVLDEEKVYLLSVNSKNYNQTLFNFIYHGPQKTVFLHTKNVEYLVCSELTENLNIRITNSIPINGSLPVTSYEKSGLLPRGAASFNLQSAKISQINIPVNSNATRLQGAAMAGQMVANGVAGIGQGLGNYLTMQQNFQNNLTLMSANQGYKSLQIEQYLKGLGKNQMNALETQIAADKEAAATRERNKNMQTMGMQNQLSYRNFQSGGIENQHDYNTGESTLLETPIEQFDLQSGKRIVQQQPISTTTPANLNQSAEHTVNSQITQLETSLNQPGTNTHASGMSVFSSPINEIATGLEDINDDIGDAITLQNLNMPNAGSSTLTPTQVAMQPRTPFAHLRNTHKLGAEPGTKVKNLKFPQV